MTASTGSDRRTVLVTGASGVIGGALLQELDGWDVIGLVHSGRLAREDAESVKADVTQPRFGLTEEHFRELAARTDVIVHSAGLVTFGLEEERYRAINVEGTKHLLELAVLADAPVHHVGTAFVKSFSPDARIKLERSNAVWGYVASKVESDRIFAESGVPHTVYRPPNLIGDSRTGEMARDQFVTQISFDALRGRFPFLPARPGERFDMAPQDLCGKAIAACVEADDIGSEYWITYGEKSPTVEELLDVGVQFAAGLGLAAKMPKLVDPDDPEALEAELSKLNKAGRYMYGRLLELTDAMSAGGTFPSSLDLLAERYSVPIPDLREAITRGLEHMAKTKKLPVPA
ncbi:MAG TPA: SDR family oxidoreductase [Thermoleophilaceae bacterium]